MSLSTQLKSSKSQLDSSFQELMGAEKIELERLLDSFQTDLLKRLDYKVDKAENMLHGQGKEQMMELRMKLKELKENVGNIRVQAVDSVLVDHSSVEPKIQAIPQDFHTVAHSEIQTNMSEINVQELPFCDDLFLTTVFNNPEKHSVKIRNTLDIHPEVVNDAMGPEVENGCYTPKHCISRQHIAMIIGIRGGGTTTRLGHLF